MLSSFQLFDGHGPGAPARRAGLGRAAFLGAALCVLVIGAPAWAQAQSRAQDPGRAPPPPGAAPAGGEVFRALPEGGFEGGEIAEIRIEGTQRIEPETVLSYLTVEPGDSFASERIDRSLKSLFATGLFADIRLRRQGEQLVVEVVENPIINEIAFEGNREVDDEQLRSEIALRPRMVYTRTRVKEAVTRILEIYRRSGRFSAAVVPKIIERPENRVDLVFEIAEGAESQVQRINFIGNRAFPDRVLRDEIRTTEARWYRFLSADDTYDPDRLEFDKQLLRRFYLSEGYADFKVDSVVAELSEDRSDFFVTFTVEEGPRYRVGEVALDSRVPDLDTAGLAGLIELESGGWYDVEAIDDSIDALRPALTARQHAFVDIRPRVERDREPQVIDVTFELHEGQRIFVERIEIEGNTRTLDRVIRREMTLAEGDPFIREKLEASRRRIQDLGFFRNVEIATRRGSAPDQRILTIRVSEQSTGQLSVGAGFSTTDGPLGNFQIREENLLGRGQKLRFSTTLSARTNQFNLSFTEPYFLGRDVSSTVELFNQNTDFQDESGFDQQETGTGFSFGFPLARNLRQNLGYRFERTEIEDIDDDASLAVLSAEGTTVLSQLSQTLTYDVRDSRLQPREGYLLRLSNDLAGLGGDRHFLRTRAEISYFHPFFDRNLILNLSGEGGYILGLGEDIEITDRFFIGGNDLRGFEVSGVGPRDDVTDDALGGEYFGIATAELGFPLGLPEELGLRGHAFTDVGFLGGIEDQAGLDVQEENTPRAAIGLGMSWRSPMGPIRVDFAYPILEEDFDETETFRFSFGTRF